MAYRRTDGFNDAGTSYSVATDFDKQLAQASAEFDAAAKEARLNRIGQKQRGNIVNPQEEAGNMDLLRRELFDPVIQSEAAYQGRTYHPDRVVRPTANRIVSDRGNIWAVDPTSGTVKQVVTAPVKPAGETKMNQRQRSDLDNVESQIKLKRRQLMSEGNNPSLANPGLTMAHDINGELVGLERQRKQILDKAFGDSNPIVAPAPALAAPVAPVGPSAPAAGIPARHIQHLIANPATAADFDRKYGPGSSTNYLHR